MKDIGVFPEEEQVAHAADFGMSFYIGIMFPERYRAAAYSRATWILEPHEAGARG